MLHTGIDVVLNACLFGSVGKSFADCDFVSPVSGVDEGTLGVFEQVVQKLAVLETADVDGHIGQLRELFSDDSVQLFHLRPYLPS